MATIYSSPESYGLETIGEIDFSDGHYQFNLIVVWRHLATGVFYYASDYGCSCPSPFENHDAEDLSDLQSLISFGDTIYNRAKESSEPERCAGECLRLLERLRQLGLR